MCPTFQPQYTGNSLSIIIKNAGSGTAHRRVIALERASWDPNLSSARLIIAYSIENLPTPMPTETSTATPTPTLTSTPTSTPTVTLSPTITPSLEPTSPPSSWAPAEYALLKDEPIEKRDTFSEMLSQIRDRILKASPKGDAYIELIYQHAPEITNLLMKDEYLRQQVKELALDAEPFLESIVSNKQGCEELLLDEAWVKKAIVVLELVEEQASPDLKKEINWWLMYLPDFVDKTGKEIWEMLPER
ncbi:MAG: hypothetical protein JXB38_08855 [Anaerolineales bacterium]|nr:hypothetical protein [Anaerolineales bacterium]